MFKVLYDSPQGVRSYCICPLTAEGAKEQAQKFRERYLNEDGTGKAFPNGRGHYPFKNVRIAPIN